MAKITAIFMVILVGVAAAGDSRLDRLASEYLNAKSRFYPVWATNLGIHDYDTLLPDYSIQAVYGYRNRLSLFESKLREIDTMKLSMDDYIDYKVFKSNLAADNFWLTRFPLHEISPALYIDDALNSLYYLMLDQALADTARASALLSRLQKIPDFLNKSWNIQFNQAKIFYETAIETAENSEPLINEIENYLKATFPDSSVRIAQICGLAKVTIRNYALTCKIEAPDAPGTFSLGKANFNYLLKNVHLLDIDSDSLKKIGWHWYEISDKAMDSLRSIVESLPPVPKFSPPNPDTFDIDDIFAYYRWEIDQTARFFSEKGLVTIPQNVGPCIPVPTPAFMQATTRGIAYEPAPVFSSDPTGRFYVRPIPPLDSLLKQKYYSDIINRTFRGSVVHEAFPGHHLQLGIARNHSSLIRKISQNTMFCEGWALYCEQMATEQGLYSENELTRRWLGVWGGIRFRAVRIIVDCGLHDGSLSPDSALALMNNLLGENTDYFVAEIRRYCANPTVASSYLIGKLQILDMIESQKKRLGKSFSLRRFHDALLSEGTIPPSLIAKKLASQNK